MAWLGGKNATPYLNVGNLMVKKLLTSFNLAVNSILIFLVSQPDDDDVLIGKELRIR